MHASILATSSDSSPLSLLLILGLVLLAAAGYGGYLWWKNQRKHRAMIGAETLSVEELKAMADAAAEAAGPGTFKYRCEVVGGAKPNVSGALKAEMSNVRCVWYRHTVTHHYWEERRDRDGDRRRQDKTKKINDMSSELPFRVNDGTGMIVVDPRGAETVEPEKVLDRFDKSGGRQKTKVKIGSFSMSLPSSNKSGTLGYKYEEWAIRPKSRLYILGEVSDSNGQLTISKPADGPFLVSTKSEEQLLEKTSRYVKYTKIGTPVAAGVGAVLVVLSFLT